MFWRFYGKMFFNEKRDAARSEAIVSTTCFFFLQKMHFAPFQEAFQMQHSKILLTMKKLFFFHVLRL
jgi:hypothetical protein